MIKKVFFSKDEVVPRGVQISSGESSAFSYWIHHAEIVRLGTTIKNEVIKIFIFNYLCPPEVFLVMVSLAVAVPPQIKNRTATHSQRPSTRKKSTG